MTDETPTEGAPQQPDPLQELAQENHALAEQMRLNGRPVDVGDELSIALQVLVDLLLPPGGPMRHLYDMQRMMQMNNYLKHQASEAARAKLTEGVIGVQP